MTRKEVTQQVTNILKEQDIKKPIHVQKQVFTISDNEGNSKKFIIQKKDMRAIYTADDVDAILRAYEDVIVEALKRGEPVSFKSFGTFGLHYRKERRTKHPATGEEVIVRARYIPKFEFGHRLRMSAQVYGMSMDDELDDLPDDLPYLDDDDYDDDDIMREDED